MSLGYIKKRYKVPAKRGGRIRYTGNVGHGGDTYDGTITSGINGRLNIRFDEGNPWGNFPIPCHPTWEIEYLDTPKQANMRRDSANCERCGKFMKWTGGFYTCTEHGGQP